MSDAESPDPVQAAFQRYQKIGNRTIADIAIENRDQAAINKAMDERDSIALRLFEIITDKNAHDPDGLNGKGQPMAEVAYQLADKFLDQRQIERSIAEVKLKRVNELSTKS